MLLLRYRQADGVDTYGLFLAAEMRRLPLAQYAPLSIYPTFPVLYEQNEAPSILSVRAEVLDESQAQFADAIVSSMKATNLSSPD